MFTAAVLFYAALVDLKHFKIPNSLIIALAALFFLHSIISGRWPSVAWHVAIALLIFAITLCFWMRNLVGGGDVKLLTVAFLWTGIDCALVFAILLAISAVVHTIVAKLEWVQMQRSEDDHRPRIPFAPSVAAALIGVFMLGCLPAVP